MDSMQSTIQTPAVDHGHAREHVARFGAESALAAHAAQGAGQAAAASPLDQHQQNQEHRDDEHQDSEHVVQKRAGRKQYRRSWNR